MKESGANSQSDATRRLADDFARNDRETRAQRTELARRAALGFWRLFTLLAAILLASTYFMPAIDCFGDPRVNPSIELRHFVKYELKHGQPDSADDIVRWLAELLVYGAPYAFAGVVGAAVVMRGTGKESWRWFATMLLSTCLAGCAGGVVFVGIVGYEMWDGEIVFALSEDQYLPCLIIPIAVLLYVGRVIRRPQFASILLSLLGSGICLVWWGRWYQATWPAYGLFWATLATVLLLIGLFAEYTVTANEGVGSALFNVAFGNPIEREYRSGHCRTCGYSQFGLTSNRCPECGTSCAHIRSFPLLVYEMEAPTEQASTS